MSQAGEKELILGNKQLISLFFVVVALCGVFFAMGYMVRGNSLKGAVAAAGDSTAPPPTNESVKRQQPEPPAETTDAPAMSPQPAESGGTAPIETHPVQTAPAADTVRPEAPAPVASLEPGSYVQVGALARADADNTVRTLREQHLPALATPSPKEGLYRVLVGPYRSTSDVAEAKATLKKLGFDTIVLKQ